jgi:uncharacterized protein (TIGR00251 family)
MCISPHEKGAVIAVRVTPRAKKTAIAAVTAQTLQIRISAPPVDGKANKELLRFLAGVLGTAPSTLRILRGESAREKLVLVEGMAPDLVTSAIMSAHVG